MKVTRDRVCKDCEGKGGKEESIAQCTKCGGAGRIAKMVKMGFMVSQTISPCDECRGRGKVIKDKCKSCKGHGVKEEVKILDIEVEKGTPEGHRYVFAGEADEYVTCRGHAVARNRAWRCHHRGPDQKGQTLQAQRSRPVHGEGDRAV